MPSCAEWCDKDCSNCPHYHNDDDRDEFYGD